MPTLHERWGVLWERIRQSPAQLPTRIDIPRTQVDRGSALGGSFQPNTHYFQVRVNEMFLANERQWFSVYDPMIFVVSEFTYDKRVEAVPFVVGPALMEQHKQPVPQGMIFADTRVA